ncbi:S-adenosyl-L-methionine-dependent methyltransferase [Naviculisporaceae sp. PSN 640]
MASSEQKSPGAAAKSGSGPASPASGGGVLAGATAPIDETSAHVEADSGDSDDNVSDNASDYHSDVSATTSVNSSIFDFQYQNGRRYHAYRAGQYLLPNDEQEQERLDIIHHVFMLTLNGQPCASMSKLDNPNRILDIGTGTGIWAVEMGDIFPSAEVIGTDLSPIQTPWVPPNVQFQIDDATLPWTFPPSHFDFIHARTLGGAIQDWPSLISQIYTHLTPGGYVELAEGRANFWCDDDSLKEDSATHKWLTEFRKLSEPLGFDISPKLSSLLEAGGFEDVSFVQRVIPLGTWPKDKSLKEIGRWFRVQFIEMALEAYSIALFTRLGGWSNEEFQVLMAQVKAELKTNKIHLYTYASYTTGRKPLGASS